MMMMLERLPNELFLNIFDYLNSIHLFHAFYGLNFRLNNLIDTSVRSYLDFRTISKSDFDIIYQQHCRSISNTTISIHIADDDATPNLPEIFFSHHFITSNFIHLQSLSLKSICSFNTLNNIVLRCHNLPYLIDLKFIECRLNIASNNIINTIWKLPKLMNCVINEDLLESECFTELIEISTSIKYLSIEDVNCDFHCLINIFQQTPYLECLSTKITSICPNEQFPINVSYLTKLTFSFRGTIESLKNLFEQMSNLRFLTLTYNQPYFGVQGNELEEIFLKYLPNVKRFRLKMNFQFSQIDFMDIEDKIDQLLATFETDFWIKKHQWFVRCDWNPTDHFNQVCLYTLPYAFNDFHLTNEFYSKSTCPNDEDFGSYDQVRNLECGKNISNQCPIEFPNLSNLEIILPINGNLFFNIPSLDHLTSLDVTILDRDSVYDQLQAILDHAPHLYLLRFSHLSELNMILFELKNSSIRRLDFFTKESMIYRWYFNKEHCLALANSSLGQQCQILVVNVEHRTIILDLINHMSKLQSLIFQCEDDKWYFKSSSSSSVSKTDELLAWFHENLPSTCLISRHMNYTSIFQLWIR